ncbi:MAG: DUF6531 domain-containing protein, partial [Actinomycetaceae bacterium]|nr:DUF6531 domain-containing protein [Actinomycetaceae bacterium]
MPQGSDQIGPLKGIDEDVRFDWAAAEECVAAFRSSADLIDGQKGTRSSAVSTATGEFRGYYADLFKQNAGIQEQDATNVATALRDAATKIERLAEEARKEQQRRETGRRWKEEHDNRNWFDKTWDAIFGEDPPGIGPAAEPIVETSPAPATGARQDLTGQGPTGTSSARPGDLRSFASTSTDLNSALSDSSSAAKSRYDAFVAGCGWGSVDASGVLTGFTTYIAANENDVHWANVVADLFEAAGSNGDVTTLSNSTIDEGLRNAGVNAVRSPTAVQPANVAGGQTTSGYADDPVNAGSGSFVEPEVDFAGAGGLAALIFTRVYNSRGGAPSGAFGPGWSSAADSRVFFTDEAGVWIREDGAHINFPRDGQGWGRAPGHTLWLEADPGGSGYIISDHQGGRWYFDAAGLLISTSRGAGTRVDFERSNGRLVRLLHERGPALVCEWEGERIVALTTWDGRRTEYFYDEAGRLIGVAGGDHGGRSYQWNSAGVVCAVSDADGVRFVENTYDEDGRVLTQRSARGALTEYTYLPGHITQVASEDGTNVWRHDDRGRLIAVTDGNGGRQNAGWDRWDGQVIFTGRDGVTTAREFDARGRLVTEGRDKVITRIEWDEQDRATRVTVTSDDTTYETLYEYEGEGRFPSRITDPEGGVTQAQWDKNLLLKIIDPTGRVTRFEYDAHGDVIGVINGVGGHARLERDEAGRITRSISPEGRVTRFEYSSAGHCVRITDPAGGVWTREYSAAGRLIAKTDPLGGRTEILVDQAGDEVGTIDELGRPFRMELDSAGMVSNVELPDGTTWEFTHDALSRLTQMRDGSGGTWDLEFDKAGHPLVGTDPTGVPTIATVGTAGFTDSITALGATYSSERDRLGRLISETGPDGASSHYEYDRCGRLVCAVDPDGGVTRYERDAAGRPVWVTLPSGLRYGYEYDAAGRWTGAVSTGGNRWSFAYDGDGNLVEEAWPTGEKVVTEYDGAGRPVRRYQPGEGTTTVAYDACGRVVRVRDPYWGVRKYTYTAAGQIETITNALGGVTRIEYDVNARPYKMIDPAGGVSLREFDGAGRTISVTDPAGMSTRITYDAAGRPIRQVHAVGESAWTYDKFGRLATETRDGMTRTWEHDPAAATTTVTATDEGGSSVTQWWWDWAGRTTRARSGTLETRWSYTPDGRLEAIVRPDGEVTRFEYDAEGALASLSRDGMGELAVERDMLGRVVSAHGDGVHMTWTWESGHLARFTSARGGDQTVVDYDRDEQGRILRRTTNGVVESFSYDEAGQLTSWSGPHGREEWSWDAMGRLRTHTNTDAGLGEVSTSYSYDTGGRLLATVTNSVAGSGASGRGVRVEYAYDEAGRRTSERTGDSWRRYSWNGSALASVTDLAKSGDSWQATAHWDLGWDTTGALATINGTPVDWQGTSPSQMGAVSVETLPGLLTMTATPNTDSLDGPTLDEAARATGLADTGLAETVAIGAAHTGGLPAGVSP